MSVYGGRKKNGTLLVGQSFSGKTYLMLKVLSRKLDQDFCIITKHLPEQCSNSKIQIKETGEEIKPLNEYEIAVLVFNDILGTSNSRSTDQFFIKGRHNTLNIYYL